jgi:type IV pilus assembly protein PilC
MTISGLLRSHWWIAMAAVVVVGVGAAFAWTSPSGRRTWDRTVVRLPYMGSVACNLLTARLVRLLGVLLDSQVPMIEALQLTQESTGNGEYAKLVGEAERWVMRGEPLSSVFERSPLIAAPVTEAVRHGEHGGRLSPVLLDMADFMDEENEAIVRTTARLVEPAMLIVLGFIVAIIALSLFVPLFDLTSLAHGGPN